MKKTLYLLSLFLTVVAFGQSVSATQIEAGPIWIKKGWNLVNGFAPGALDQQSLSSSHIKSIYAFIPTIQQYAQVYPNPDNEKIDSIGDGYLARTALWVYSDSDGQTNYSVQEPLPIDTHQLYKGWNLVGVTPEIVESAQQPDLTLNDISGTCRVDKAYVFDDGKWVNLILEAKSEMESTLIWDGVALKVQDNCHLGFAGGRPVREGTIIPVPQLPN
ncbi:MAG: hypothetical protein AAB589_01150 [Patescibacteria group bacterium]